MRHSNRASPDRASTTGGANVQMRSNGQAASSGQAGNHGLRQSLRGMNYAEGSAAVSPVQMRGGDERPLDADGANDGANPTVVNDNYQGYGDLYDGGNAGVLYDGAPDPYDVIQRAGQLADCWLVGSMAALAAANPDYIQNELMPDTGKTITVNLFYARSPSHPIEKCPQVISLDELPVQQNDAGQAEPAYSMTNEKAPGNKNILWVVALEMAAAKLFTEKNVKDDNAELGGDYLRLAPGSASYGMMVLTGNWPEAYGADKAESKKDREKREAEGGPDPQTLYKNANGDSLQLPPAVVAAKVKRALDDGQPVTGVMDGHVVPVMKAEGGPDEAEVMAWLENPTPGFEERTADAMSTFTVHYYNQNLPDEKHDPLVGWADVTGTFAKGFRFGIVPE